MIRHEEIKDLEVEWRLREDVIEKDYVLGWVLWGIGSDPALSNAWIFKGGTCRRCYRVDRMESIQVTSRPFTPQYAIEFSPQGHIAAAPTPRRSPFTRYGR